MSVSQINHDKNQLQLYLKYIKPDIDINVICDLFAVGQHSTNIMGRYISLVFFSKNIPRVRGNGFRKNMQFLPIKSNALSESPWSLLSTPWVNMQGFTLQAVLICMYIGLLYGQIHSQYFQTHFYMFRQDRKRRQNQYWEVLVILFPLDIV